MAKATEPAMIYIETMAPTNQMWTCAVCKKLIRWPENVRVYAESLHAKPSRFEHADHLAQKGTEKMKARGHKS